MVKHIRKSKNERIEILSVGLDKLIVSIQIRVSILSRWHKLKSKSYILKQNDSINEELIYIEDVGYSTVINLDKFQQSIDNFYLNHVAECNSNKQRREKLYFIIKNIN